MNIDNIWIGHCYDILYLDQFSLGEKESYPLQKGEKRTGTKESSAFNFTTNNIDKWSRTTTEALTIGQSSNNVISSSQSYQTKLKTAVNAKANYLAYSGSLSTEVNSLVKNDLSKKQVTTLTTSTRKTKKISLINEDSSNPPPLDSTFQNTLWSAASSQNKFNSFVKKYGTHFSSTVTLGGVGKQTFILKAKSMAKLSELGVDISAQASGVLKMVEVEGGLHQSVGINDSFLKDIESQKTDIKYLGGTSSRDFDTWLESVDNNPVPIEVTLIDHSFFFNANYFPKKSNIEETKESFQTFLNSYIQSNGRDLGASQISDGDLICICALSDKTGNDLPPMLVQSNNPVSTQTIMKSLNSTVSINEFLDLYAKNYSQYVWKIEHADLEKKGKPFALTDLITLTNLKTGYKLNGEGANPDHGWVSAANNSNILGKDLKKSNIWRIKNRIEYFDDSIENPINSGDIISFHRMYISPSPADPTGYLHVRNKLAFSTGQLLGRDSIIENSMAFQIFKLNTTN
ncbi:MAC/perforin domain-containing protein [uncultured Aquimarina sp.]|uniref:MAC/perforin domain-containing protein n=1 Tax=uncultured Aquimarina sp. TaxID=575652 RepID=UPI00260871F4|nr:MAC/perforin domain-containing protein [uncultured Aquimarina sp.]